MRSTGDFEEREITRTIEKLDRSSTVGAALLPGEGRQFAITVLHPLLELPDPVARKASVSVMEVYSVQVGTPACLNV